MAVTPLLESLTDPLPVLVMVKLPLISSILPIRDKSPVCEVLFQVTLPKAWPKVDTVGTVLVIPVILQLEAAFHVAVGIDPPLRLWIYVAPDPKASVPVVVRAPEPPVTSSVPFVLKSVPVPLAMVSVTLLTVTLPPASTVTWSTVTFAVTVTVCIL